MRRIFYGCVVMLALVVSPAVAVDDADSHRTAAENLLIVMEVDKSLEPLAEQVLETHLQQNPQLAPQREVLQKFLTRYLDWASVRQETITAYTQAFTETELKQLTKFYTTALGKKASEKMPQLAFIAGQIGLQKAQAHHTELQQMIEKEQSKHRAGK